ncbi:uncharacterized protein C1orf159 homolog isoform X7 [Canis lupus familiaris]|uniref:uncharacterized protein C1orf159 homolog isoform X7 n=1 Tax=Canis lupus familiaris TaxID=9615 RepID=UPI0018F41FFB|nr:uncharacterized protein C1orf159 homolog isoform X7 [Canis lupus familiaris]XP_038393490.1 uncharacterized protein C1orf159 homolog isoform X7 [Canis lupus familiaris]XP_038522219.1 uncharacterized protein C1orf159 homolog isoform X7 [Canis lupus familiaris]
MFLQMGVDRDISSAAEPENTLGETPPASRPRCHPSGMLYRSITHTDPMDSPLAIRLGPGICSFIAAPPCQLSTGHPLWMSAAPIPEGQTLCSGIWRSSVPSSWRASWWKLPANPQKVWVSSLNAVWTCWPLTPPARAQACVVQHRNLQALPSAGCPCRKVFSPRHIAATDTRMRTAVSAVSAARTAPTALPAVAALLHPPPGPHGLLPTEGLHLQVLEERSLAGVHSSR